MLLRNVWRWAPVTYIRKQWPRYTTDANLWGHRLHARLHFAAGHTEGSKVAKELLDMEEERGPRGRNCVDIVFGHFEQCYLRQCEAVGQSIILLLEQLRWLFIQDLWYWLASKGSRTSLLKPSLCGPCPWELVTAGFPHECLFTKTKTQTWFKENPVILLKKCINQNHEYILHGCKRSGVRGQIYLLEDQHLKIKICPFIPFCLSDRCNCTTQLVSYIFDPNSIFRSCTKISGKWF